jgi:hypothetical protein
MVSLAEFFEFIRADKWRLRTFCIIFGFVFGTLAALITPSSYITYSQLFQNLVLYGFVMTYVFYVFLAGHTKQIFLILPKFSKKITSYKIFRYWTVTFCGLIIIETLVILNYPSIIFVLIYLYSIIALITIYPCLVSLAVYVPAFKYLRNVTGEIIEKRNIVKSLVIVTIGLASPWIVILFFIFAFFTIPFWVDYVVVPASYLVIFFLAIDLPYY